MVKGAEAPGRLSRGLATPEGCWLTVPSFDLWDLSSEPLKVAHAPMRKKARVEFLPDGPDRL